MNELVWFGERVSPGIVDIGRSSIKNMANL